MNTKIVGIIPARLASTRLPNKPLLDIAGKPMIQHVYDRASASSLLDSVLVATPDVEILRCVESFGGRAVLTSHAHTSGTDRLAEVARTLDADIIVNIQGDEPLLDCAAIDMLARAMSDDPSVCMSSMMAALHPDEACDPSVVKVVIDLRGFALYFSRSAIPFPRAADEVQAKKHIGIYAYRREFLIALSEMAPTPLERAESLEQLRVLENGYSIKMVQWTGAPPMSVDTPDDLSLVRKICAGER